MLSLAIVIWGMPIASQGDSAISITGAALSDLLIPVEALAKPASYHVRNRFLRISSAALYTHAPAASEAIERMHESRVPDYFAQAELVRLLDECSSSPGSQVRANSESWHDGDVSVVAGENFARQQVVPLEATSQSYLFLPEGKLEYNGQNRQLSIHSNSIGLEILRPQYLFSALPITREKRELILAADCTVQERRAGTREGAVLRLRVANSPMPFVTSELIDFDATTRLPIAAARIYQDERLDSVIFYSIDGSVRSDVGAIPKRMTAIVYGQQMLVADFVVTDYVEIGELNDAQIPIAERTMLFDFRQEGTTNWQGSVVEQWPEWLQRRVRVVAEGGFPPQSYSTVDAPAPVGSPQENRNRNHQRTRGFWGAIIGCVVIGFGFLWTRRRGRAVEPEAG